MTSRNDDRIRSKDARRPYRVRLPGFMRNDEIGLGEVVKRVSYAAGVKPCGGCQRRADTLSRWVVFTR